MGMLGIIYGLICVAGLWLSALFFLRKIWFYRDPQRTPDESGDVLIAPADGRVVYIRRVEDGGLYAEKLGQKIPLPEIAGCEVPGEKGWAIGIYMSPLDVHFNYAPMAAKVERIEKTSPRLNLPMLDLWEYIKVVWLRRMVDMFARRYHLENERGTIIVDAGSYKAAVVLIADKFVSKIRCFVQVGQDIATSDKLGFIERGSQVDLIVFREDVEFVVALNQQVYGGQTVIARVGKSEGSS